MDFSSSHLLGVEAREERVSSSRIISSSETGIFDSVFSPAPPFTVVGKDLSYSELIASWRKQESLPRLPSTQHVCADAGSNPKRTEGEGRSIPNKVSGSIFQEETIEPCSLSSSLYYGGPDICPGSLNAKAPGSPHLFKNGGHEDDSVQNNYNCASRGNWWQGSLYY